MINLVIIPILLIIFFLLIFVILAFLLFVFDAFLDLPYVATDRKKINTIVKFANIRHGQTIVDLGSGDGRLLIAAAQQGAKAVGYELNPLLIAVTLIHAKIKGLSNSVWVERKNLWKADLKVADVIFVYGRSRTMKKFEDFVFKSAKKDTLIIVNTDKTVPFPNKKPAKQENGIYLYIV